MTLVPLPDRPTIRVRMTGTDDAGNDWGTRFYLAYAGTAPTGDNCTTLAGDIEAAFATNLAGLMSTGMHLTEVDVLDIATETGLSGQWTGSEAGSRSGNSMPVQVAFNVEYGIARRYRGGKPRAYWPFGVQSDQENQGNWTSGLVASVNTDIAAFFTALQALSVGAVGALTHINLSYYKGFTNVVNSSGRERAVPTYRATALSDTITGYFAKQEFGSQKRRRTSSTP